MRTILALLATTALAQPPGAARKWRESHEPAIVREYIELLSIPNVARDRANLRRNAEFIERMYQRRGVRTRILEAPNTPPAVYGEIRTPGATQTLMFYAHYDGQPVEPKEWFNNDPFKPTLLDKPLDAGGKPIPLPARFDPESRLYARSAGDDKAPILAFATALDALKAAAIPLKSNIKFFFEGEEEAGSPHLAALLSEHKDLLKADLWLFCDGPVHQTRRQTVVFGVRGATGFNLTVYGPKRELHSGHYGNWAPNPAMMLARLLASMKDDDGRVLIDRFYDGIAPLGDLEKQALAGMPKQDAALRRELQLARADGSGEALEGLLNYPSLNIRGLASAGVGAQSRNVIPTEATASLDIRLVKGVDHATAIERVRAHIRKQGYFITDRDPDEDTRLTRAKIAKMVVSDGYDALRTPMDLPIARKVIAAVESARGKVIRMPTMGGSLPLSIFDDVLKTPVIIIPIANHDNNQHGHNENMRIQNLWDGIETMAALLAMD